MIKKTNKLVLWFPSLAGFLLSRSPGCDGPGPRALFRSFSWSVRLCTAGSSSRWTGRLWLSLHV